LSVNGNGVLNLPSNGRPLGFLITKSRKEARWRW